MSIPAQHEFTDLLLAWRNGDQSALERLTTLIYGELHRLARHHMQGERQGHILQTTALINEAYLRLIDGSSRIHWQNRAHFLAMASKLMRRVLVDIARKRVPEFNVVSLTGIAAATQSRLPDIVAIDEALERFEKDHPQEAKMCEWKFFGGLKGKEIAREMGVSPATVTRQLKFADLWLRKELSS